jgi:hypothetical protein
MLISAAAHARSPALQVVGVVADRFEEAQRVLNLVVQRWVAALASGGAVARRGLTPERLATVWLGAGMDRPSQR